MTREEIKTLAADTAKSMTAEQLIENFEKLMAPLPCEWEDQEQRELRRVVSLEAVKEEILSRMSK